MTTTTLLEEITTSQGQEIHDPATGELIGHAPLTSAADLDDAVARAVRAQPAWAAAGHSTRQAALQSAADAVEAHAEELAQLLSREQGKPLNGPNARFEVGACVAWLRTAASIPVEPEVLLDDESGHAELHYRPLGVVGAIGPWNWPMMISIWQIAPSLRMGNTVVIKPSEYTPLSVLALVKVLNSALPADVLIAVPATDPGQAAHRASGHREDHVHRVGDHRQGHHQDGRRHHEADDHGARRQ